jgi:hypothetical protein
MNKAGSPLLLLALAASFGCAGSGEDTGKAPELSDPPVLAEAKYARMDETAPAYGVADVDEAGNIEISVNVGKVDARGVQIGQRAVAWQLPGGKPVPCVVRQILRDVNKATGQSIVRLKPETIDGFVAWSFIYAEITVKSRRVLAVPSGAVLVLNGSSVVVRATGKDGDRQYKAAPVVVSEYSWDQAAIKKGLKPGDQVVIRGALGFLYPGFAGAGSD